ncbi:MAG TPA: 1,4-alpha-glucan branching protein domain-containing protein [Opitutaceae bacterium]|nr:1,4-alpha-glucan branching protein domain-containing protein [Opitutaceae bacterium]
MSQGYLAFVLHAHLPFVRHPEYDRFLEEQWLFEAINETYLPLLRSWRRLADEGVPFHVTLSLSPSLLAMLEDPLLRGRFVDHLDRLVELCGRERERLRGEPHFAWLAEYYEKLFREHRAVFAGCDGRLALAFRDLHRRGVVELATCAATHGLLPLLASQPKTVEAQVATGLDYFEQVMGFRARGFWLPECGFYPGVEDVLRRHGVRYFFTESVGVEHADAAPAYGVHAPLYTNAGVAAFARDQAITKEVWSAEAGFPGDPDYREFYHDIGHDLPWDYIRPHLPGDVRSDTGIKYYRITGKTPWKQPYQPEAAREKAARHAAQFVFKRVAHLDYLATVMPTAPLITAPFDAELFGHWWFEGPQWLDYVIRKTAYDQRSFALITPSAYLDGHPVHQRATPACSTWGRGAYFDYWLNGQTDWIFAHLKECGARMEALAARHGAGDPPPPTRRALNQCVRELLLAQASDWPFIISGGTAAQYAARRVKDHVSRFHALADALDAGAVDESVLGALEYLDNPFPNADYRKFA